MANVNPRPIVLIILDGWGHRKNTHYNAIALAKTPYWNYLTQSCPYTVLEASGLAVGLPAGQMGNSEVGHLSLGSGRIIYQDLTRINHSIEEGDFFKNPVLLSNLKKVRESKKSLHIVGLLSSGGVHSHEAHIYSLLEAVSQHSIKACYLHPILDGRDAPPQSAELFIKRLEAQCQRLSTGKIASLVGRYYAMDRDKRWERTKMAYDCLTLAKGTYSASTAMQGLELAYERGETDEFIKPTTIEIQEPAKIAEGDAVIFMNFRPDRMRQLCHAFLDQDFSCFPRQVRPRVGQFISLTEYAADIPSQVIFPPQVIKNTLGEYVSTKGLSQLRLAETEKYAHVTFFFNGGIEAPFPHESRCLVPSKKVRTYDVTPKMSAKEITDHLLKEIKEKKHDLIICNYANPDMLGHTGNFEATLRAINYMDQCLERVSTCLKKFGGEVIITADHGNAECMYDETIHQPHTAHTSEPVPFLYVGRPSTIKGVDHPSLMDVAPTLLGLLGLPQPPEMTGRNLLNCIP